MGNKNNYMCKNKFNNTKAKTVKKNHTSEKAP